MGMTLTLPVPTLADASFVTPQLAVGGSLAYDDELAARQVAELVSLGVTHIVDLREEWSDEEFVTALESSLTYLHLGVDDHGGAMEDDWFDAGVAAVVDAVAGGGTVLVHCHMGVNRGPSMAFAALLELGWAPTDALEALRAARPIAAVLYAADALAWHLRRQGVVGAPAAAELAELDAWFDANPHDTSGVIARIRRLEARGEPLTPARYADLRDSR